MKNRDCCHLNSLCRKSYLLNDPERHHAQSLPAAPEIGGVDQSYDMVAANAVDLVVSQLNSNETGVPPWPRMLLFPGRWVEAVPAVR
jgi:hypothetical protein